MVINIVQVLNGIYAIGPIPFGAVAFGTIRGEIGNSPFLVVGERAAIVEPGEHSQVPSFLEAVSEIGVTLDRIDYIIPTHLHLHHCASLNRLLPDIPQAKVVVHERGVPHALDPTRLNLQTQQIMGEGCNLALDPVPEDRIISVAGGEVFDLGGRKLEIIDAPGHAPHNIGIYDTLTRALWCGDFPEFQVNSKRGSVEMTLPLFHVERALETLRRFRACHPAVLLKWHSGACGIAHYQPELLIGTAIEDILAIEQICLEGLRKKLALEEINRQVGEYLLQVGGRPRRVEGMFPWVRQKYPELEIPER